MTAYYNEIEPYAAEWLRNLIAAGHIAPGVVDTRSIEDVQPDDLREFTQCHFFAGVGAWSLALRRAGWGDDRPVWTGSCPCQPFSAAGQGSGFADERHLWPAFHHLIRQRRPAVVLGEQVASKDVEPWIDLVQDDLEGVGYRFGAIPFPSAGVGAPHIRDRLYWAGALADAPGLKSEWRAGGSRAAGGRSQSGAGAARHGDADRLDHADHTRLEGLGGGHQAARRQREGSIRPAAAPSELGGLANDHQHGRAALPGAELHNAAHHAEPRRDLRGLGDAAGATGKRYAGSVPGPEAEVDREGCADGCLTIGPEHAGASLGSGQPGPTNGYWRDADWLGCRDGKWRPVEPGTFPLAHGAAARVGRLRAYGNAINAEAARVFIEAVMEAA